MEFQFICCSAQYKTIFNNGDFDYPKRQKMKIYVECMTVYIACVINQFSLDFVIVCNLPLRGECIVWHTPQQKQLQYVHKL